MNGGYVGGAIGDGFVSVVGNFAYLLPVPGVAIGALMVRARRPARVRTVRHRPHRHDDRTGALVGSAHGGYVGQGLEDRLGRLIGSTGTQILGVFLRPGRSATRNRRIGGCDRSPFPGHAVRSAARRPSSRRRRAAEPVPDAVPAATLTLAPAPAPIDDVEAFPDVLSPAPLLVLDPEPEAEPEPVDDGQSLHVGRREADHDAAVYTLPDADLLRRSKAAPRDPTEASGRISGILVQALAKFGVDATVVGEIAARA